MGSKMHLYLKRLVSDESGAVTVDWVVLTAAIVGLAVGVISSVKSGPEGIAETISDKVAEIKVNP